MILMDVKGHLVSTVNSTELHTFAQRLGLKRSWFQVPATGERHAHYNLTSQSIKDRAEDMGAKLVSSINLLKLAWWNK